jgi:hypothetical protein
MAYHAADNDKAEYAKRVAYLIDHGKIAVAYNVKDTAGHAAQVLKDATGKA